MASTSECPTKNGLDDVLNILSRDSEIYWDGQKILVDVDLLLMKLNWLLEILITCP